MMNARSRAWSARNARPFSIRASSERAIDHLHERSLLAENQALRFRHPEILAPFRVRADRHSITLVGSQVVEGDEGPSNVVRAFVRQKVTDQVTAASRNDAAPVLRVLPERLAL